MAALTLWAHGIFCSFCMKTCANKFLVLGRGISGFGLRGGRGGSAKFVFMGAGIFLIFLAKTGLFYQSQDTWGLSNFRLYGRALQSHLTATTCQSKTEMSQHPLLGPHLPGICKHF